MYRIGTSGYNYAEWKGSFYPEKMPSAKMLPYYAERFSTVEINYTFYRMPSEKTIEGWVDATPDGFLFTLKASRRITHHAKLRDCDELAGLLFERSRGLGDKLGIVLFQLPPYFKKDIETLGSFLDLVPSDVRTAFEFRSKSWLSDEVYELLRTAGPPCASRTTRSSAHRSRSPLATPTSGSGTRDTPRRASPSGPIPSAPARAGSTTCSYTSSTRTRASAPSSPA